VPIKMLAVQIWAFCAYELVKTRIVGVVSGGRVLFNEMLPRHTSGGYQAVHGRTGQLPGCGQPVGPTVARDRRPASEHVVPSRLGWLGMRTKRPD
jgi:hypothetical protein